MNKIQFIKYRNKIIAINLFTFIIVLTLPMLAIFNQNFNKVLFSDNYLPLNIQHFLTTIMNCSVNRWCVGSQGTNIFNVIWFILVLPLLFINWKYFKIRNKYNIQEKIIQKDSKSFQKKSFYIFLVATIGSFSFLVFTLEETFYGKFGYSSSDSASGYAFFAFFVSLILTLATKLL